MRNLKQIISIVMAVIMCIALASCTLATNIEIQENGACKLTTTVTASETELEKIKELYTSMVVANSVVGANGAGMDGAITGVADIQSAIDMFKEESDNSGLTQEIDGVKYYTTEEDSGVQNVKDATEYFEGLGEVTTTEFWAYANSEEYEDLSLYSAYGIKIDVVLNVKMPYKVVKTNGAKVDDYTVRFDMLKDRLYYVTTEKSVADWTKSADIRKTLISKVKKNSAPAKITGVKVVYKDRKSLKISWYEEFGNVTGYKVMRKVGKGKWKTIKTITTANAKYDKNYDLYIVDKKVKANKKYSYKVRAYWKTPDFTSMGKFSKVKAVTFANLKTKPVITVKAKNNSAVVKIKKKTKNIAGYEIMYAKNAKFKKAKKVTTKKLTKTIKKLSDGKTYYFKVRKYCKGANKKVYSPWSKKVSDKIK